MGLYVRKPIHKNMLIFHDRMNGQWIKASCKSKSSNIRTKEKLWVEKEKVSLTMVHTVEPYTCNLIGLQFAGQFLNRVVFSL